MDESVFVGEKREAPTQALTAGDVFTESTGEFECARQRFAEQLTTTDILLAGQLLRFEILGYELSKLLLRSFEHLAIPSSANSTPDLLIRLHDRRVSGTGISDGRVVPGYEVSWATRNGFAYVAGNRRYFGLEIPDVSMWLSLDRNELICTFSSVDSVPHEEKGKPLLSLLLHWLREKNLHWTHAGLVALHGSGVLLAGPAGTGKSTVSLACAIAGFDYLADDYCVLESRDDGMFSGHAVYGSGQLFEDHLRRFTALSPIASPGISLLGKKQVFLADCAPAKLASSTRVCAVLFPVVVPSGETRVRPAKRSDAYIRLFSSAPLLPGMVGYDRTVEISHLLARDLPAFWLELGPDLSEIAPTVGKLISDELSD